MNKGFVYKSVKKNCIKQFFAWTIIGLIAFIVMNYLYQPFTFGNQKEFSEFKEIQNHNNKEAFGITIPSLNYSGLYFKQYGKIEAFYYIAYYKESCLLIRIPANDQTVPKEKYVDYKAILKISDEHIDLKIRDKLISELAQQTKMDIAQVNKLIFPQVLVSLSFTDKCIYFFINLLFLVIGVISWILALKSLFTRFNIDRSPAIRNLEKYGHIDEVCDDIDLEIKNNTIFKVEKITITKKWLIISRTFSTDITTISSIVWVYVGIVKHKSHGIPTGTSYSLNLYFEDKKYEKVAMKSDDNLYELLDELCRLNTSAVSGYTAELKLAWNKDKASFINSVISKRQN